MSDELTLHTKLCIIPNLLYASESFQLDCWRETADYGTAMFHTKHQFSQGHVSEGNERICFLKDAWFWNVADYIKFHESSRKDFALVKNTS